MTTIEYDRTIAKRSHLRQIGMSVADYINQLSLFDTELNPDQIELLKSLDHRGPRRTKESEQAQLFD